MAPWAFLLLLAVLTAGGCRVDASVAIVVDGDGSGTVTVGLILDDEAVDLVGGIEEQLRIDDLADAEWTVVGPNRLPTGDTTVTATKSFDSPERLADVLDEIVGPGVFEDVTLTRHRTFARTEWRLNGRVDLSGGLELFSDPELAETLSGLPLGRTTAELAELARRLDVLLHIHVAETTQESAELEAVHGSSVVRILADHGVFEGDVLAAHCVWVDDDDIRLLAEYGVAVAHCPVSNMKLGSGVAPLARMLEAGVTVALGTDGPASNDTLDLWEEVKMAPLLARVTGLDATLVGPAEVLAMATRIGEPTFKSCNASQN